MLPGPLPPPAGPPAPPTCCARARGLLGRLLPRLRQARPHPQALVIVLLPAVGHQRRRDPLAPGGPRKLSLSFRRRQELAKKNGNAVEALLWDTLRDIEEKWPGYTHRERWPYHASGKAMSVAEAIDALASAAGAPK